MNLSPGFGEDEDEMELSDVPDEGHWEEVGTQQKDSLF
jgi:hypothetical protein